MRLSVMTLALPLLWWTSPVLAADHADGPAVLSAPAADITDLSAWESGDGSQTFFVLDTLPGAGKSAAFSSRIQYVLHVTAADKYGETDPSKISRENIICQFDGDQTIHCWLGAGTTTGITTAIDYAHGNAGQSSGVTSINGKLQVFAGPRSDPFFFNLDGFGAATRLVQQSFAGRVQLDASGCPSLPIGTPTAVNAQLRGSSPASGSSTPGAPVNAYAGKNVLGLVIAVNTQALTHGTNPILGVWASTHAKP